jgi:uncharacterized protein
MYISGFEWDREKESLNEEKHGVNFRLAKKAFEDPRRVIAHDDAHSTKEERFYCFGKVGKRVMTVRFTIRGSRIRIFGAGYWRKGRQAYDRSVH